MAQPKLVVTEPEPADPELVAVETPVPEPDPALLLHGAEPPAGYILGFVEHTIDSVPDQHGVSYKINVHTPGYIPVRK